ncbi:MAG: hypothetical protein ABIP55_01995, partial [Tepidisphaeraceae bacterium]
MNRKIRPLILLFFLCGLCAKASAQTAPGFEKRWLSGIFYGEGANFGDFNKDAKPDVVSGPYIYDGPDFTTKREFMPREPADPLHYSQNFFAYTGDFNNDSNLDILIIGFPGVDAHWYENPGPTPAPTATPAPAPAPAPDAGKPIHWKKHLAMHVVDNESPALINLVGDDAAELVCMNGGRAGYASPDKSDPTKPWVFHPVTPKRDYQRFTHGLGAGDVNGDG